jgi:hypothetical protein
LVTYDSDLLKSCITRFATLNGGGGGLNLFFLIIKVAIEIFFSYLQ